MTACTVIGLGEAGATYAAALVAAGVLATLLAGDIGFFPQALKFDLDSHDLSVKFLDCIWFAFLLETQG